MYAEPDRQAPGKARVNGREAIREAIQHHVDRLSSNRTHSEFMGPRQPARSNVGGGDPLGVVKDVQRGWRHPTVDPGHGFNPLDAVGQVSRQAARMFNPTTKAGLANMASMFAGGPKEGFDPQLEAMGHVPYGMESAKDMRFNPSAGRALDRGLANEGPISPTGSPKGAGIRGLVRRSQGVGGYRQADPGQVIMQRIEALRKIQSENLKNSDTEKAFSNSLGAGTKRNLQGRAMNRAFEQKMGGNLKSFGPTQYRPGVQSNPLGDNTFMDRQSHDFADRMKLLNLSKNNPENELLPQGASLDPIKQALYDMLFSGKGLLRRPTRPGPSNPGGSPYGGGPFG